MSQTTEINKILSGRWNICELHENYYATDSIFLTEKSCGLREQNYFIFSNNSNQVEVIFIDPKMGWPQYSNAITSGSTYHVQGNILTIYREDSYSEKFEVFLLEYGRLLLFRSKN